MNNRHERLNFEQRLKGNNEDFLNAIVLMALVT